MPNYLTTYLTQVKQTNASNSQETRTLPAPSQKEVQIAVSATGLCGSDLHYYRHFRNGNIIVQEPLTLGHESAGVVTAAGSGVTNLKVGDRVALEVGIPCSGEEGKGCEQCKAGRYNICKAMRFRSSAKSFPHAQGTLQSRINHPAEWCHKLPSNDNTPMSLELGALVEPLSVAMHAYKRSGLPSSSYPSSHTQDRNNGSGNGDGNGKTILVLGAGAVGLLCAAVAKINGAKTVLIADILPERVTFAVENGFADAAYTVTSPAPDKKPESIDEKLAYAQAVAEEMRGVPVPGAETIGEVDATFECTGVESCMHMAIYVSSHFTFSHSYSTCPI